MTKRALLATMAVAVIIAVTASAQGPVPTTLPAGSNLLVGRVVDAQTGSAIANAIVAMSFGVPAASGRAPTQRVLTDAQGRFFFGEIGAGTFYMTATKPGWIDGAVGRTRPAGAAVPVTVRDGERHSELTIPLWRYAVIAGRVVDDRDEPLVGTDVRIFQGSFAAGRRQWSFVERAITDDRGAYRFSRLLPAAYLVVVPAAVTSEPASMRGSNALPTSYYQTMSPIGAAPMTFEAARLPAGGGSLVTSLLGLPGAPSTDAAWMTYPTTFFPSTTSIGTATVVEAVSGRERANIDIVMRLTPTFSVSGTIAAPSEIAPGFHAVHLLPAESAQSPLFDVATAVTDPAGAFTFYGVPPGQYVARIVRTPAPSAGRMALCGGTGAISFICTTSAGPGSGPAPPLTEPLLFADAPVSVVDRAVRGVTLQLRAGAAVKGHLEFEGTTAPPTPAASRAMTVFLDPAGGQTFKAAGGYEELPVANVSENRHFAISSAWPGRYVVRVNAPVGWTLKRAIVEGKDVTDAPFDLARDVDDLVITFTDQVAQLSGTVQRANGTADADASVLLFPEDPAGWVDYGRSTRRVRVVPTSKGAYTMPAPPAGTYFLIALPDSQLDDWQNPAFLKRAAALADRVTVRDAQAIAHPLRTRSLP